MSKKFRKYHKIIPCGNIVYRQRKSLLASYVLRVLEPFNITRSQIALCRAVVNKFIKQNNKHIDRKFKGSFYKFPLLKGSFRLPVFPYNPLTSKAQGSRMGKGKGVVSDYYYPLKAGSILFEFYFVDLKVLKSCLEILQYKMPVKFRLVKSFY